MGLSPEMRAEFKAKLEVGFKEDKEKREKYKDKYRDRVHGELVETSLMVENSLHSPWESLAFYYENELMEKDEEIARLTAKLDELYWDTRESGV